MKRNPAAELLERRKEKAKVRALRKRLRAMGISTKPAPAKPNWTTIAEVKSITGPSTFDPWDNQAMQEWKDKT